MSSHTLPVLAVAVGAVLVAAYGVYRTRQSWQLRAAISSASDASAGTLQAGQGPIELNGTARAAEHTFRSPLTDQHCVAYRFVKEDKQKKRVRDHTSDGNRYKTKYEWVTIHDEASGAPFYVDDGSGRVLVDGATADLDMERSYEIDTDDVEQGIGETVVASVKGLVGGDTETEDHEIPDKYVEELRNASHGRRFKEWVVHEGEDVYVYGEAVRPDQTPLGSGFESEMSAASGAMQGGILGMLKGLIGLGAEAATNPQTRYKPRAIKRLPNSEVMEDGSQSEAAQELREQASQIDQENAQRDPEATQMEQASEVFQGARDVAADALPETPAVDDASVVVSWGEQAPTFVVSDQGKGSVLRDYSTGIATYALLTIVSVAVAVGAAAFALDLVPV